MLLTSFRRDEVVKELDYPLQNSALDVPLRDVLSLDEIARQRYINNLLTSLSKVIKKDEFALKGRISFADERPAEVATYASRQVSLYRRAVRSE
jgi:hypothetical protein